MLRFPILFSVSIVFAFIADDMILITGSDNRNDIYNADSASSTSLTTNTALAQTMNSNKTQLWIDKENNAKIIFTYNPESPIIGNPTKLLFSVQDLRTGDEIKEGVHARIIVTNERGEILKITNSTFADGNFSINYSFPDSGSYKIISKIDSNNVAELASFNVSVAPSALSSTSKSFVSLILYYVTPITASAAGIAIYLSYRRRI